MKCFDIETYIAPFFNNKQITNEFTEVINLLESLAEMTKKNYPRYYFGQQTGTYSGL